MTEKVEKLVKMPSLTLLCGVSACVVVALRCLTPTNLGYDLTMQIQAANNLLTGNGLSIHSGLLSLFPSHEPSALVHFPAGYSIYAALLMSLGVPSFLVVKISGSLATLIGWFGWGRYLETAFSDGGKSSIFVIATTSVLALSLPLVATPNWNGTDIFLWSAVPWVLLGLPSSNVETGSSKRYFMLGILCSFLFVFRYAAAGLLLFVGLHAVYRSLPSWRNAVWNVTALAVGALPFLFLQVGWVWAAGAENQAHVATDGLALHSLGQKVVDSLPDLPTVAYTLLWLAPNAFTSNLSEATSWFALAVNWIVAACILLMPMVFARKAEITDQDNSRAVLLSDSAWFVAVYVAFLAAATVIGSFEYIGYRRYYIVLIPLVAVLIIQCGIACPYGVSLTSVWRTMPFAILSIMFIGSLLVRLAVLPIGGSLGEASRRWLMADAFGLGVFRVGLHYDASDMRKDVISRMQQNPYLRMITNRESWFFAESQLDQERLSHLPPLRAKNEVVWINGPVQLLFVFSEKDSGGGKPLALVSSTGERVNVPEGYLFDGVSNWKIYNEAWFAPRESTYVFELNIPEGDKCGLVL